MIKTRKIEIKIMEDNEKIRNEKFAYLNNLINNSIHASNDLISVLYSRCNNTLIPPEIFKECNEKNKELQIKREELKKKQNEDKKVIKNKYKEELENAKSKSDKKEIMNKIKKEQDEMSKLKYMSAFIELKGKMRDNVQKIKNEKLLNAETIEFLSDESLYKQISKRWSLPSYIAASITKKVKDKWESVKNDVLSGDVSLSSYKKESPVPFMKDCIRNLNIDGFEWLKNEIDINFKFNFGTDKSNNKSIIQGIIDNKYKLCDSMISYDGSKIYFLLCVDIPILKNNLDKNIITGADTGMIKTLCWHLKGNAERTEYYPGFFKLKEKLKSTYERKMSELKNNKGGRGRRRKMEFIYGVKRKRKKLAKCENQCAVNKLINYMIKNNSGTLQIELLNHSEDENKYIIRNWDWSKLQRILEFKTKEIGIDIIYVDPTHTSQECHKCHKIGERPNQKTFICKNPECMNYDKKFNADSNAAINIANSNKIVKDYTECEWYKNKKNIEKDLTK